MSIWRSPDLSSGSWERVGTAAHCATDIPDCGILYRPHMVQHPSSGRFLLYVNYVRKDGGYGGNAVLGADRPEGPFVMENPVMNLARLCPGPAAAPPCGEAQGGAGDYDVFVDPADGVGYIVYGANFWLSGASLPLESSLSSILAQRAQSPAHARARANTHTHTHTSYAQSLS